MKILLCTNAYENVSNGPAKFAHLIQQITQQYPDYDVRVLTEDVTVNSEQVYKIQLKIPSILKWSGMFLRMFQYHRMAMQIKRESFPFDILIYNNAIVGLWSAVRLKRVYGFINDDNNSSASFSDAFLRLKWNKSHIFFITEWLACRWFEKIIVNSNYLRDEMIRRYKCRTHKLFRMYKAVETEGSPVTRDLNAVPVILFVKNDYQRGGLQILVNALSQLPVKCKLVIVGTPLFAKVDIERMLSSASIEFEIKEIIPQHEVYRLMSVADIFCVPSLKEALGVANIEAMRFGCAVVSTQTGGIPEVLDFGKCGWLVRPNDAASLKEALLECLTNHDLRKQKIEYARLFSKKFSLDQMFSDFKEIVEQ